MKAGTGLPTEMRDLLRRNGTLLTGNARAARELHRLYAQAMQAEGETTWATPAILDLHSWLTAQWNALVLAGDEERALMNSVQERQVWESIIAPAVVHVSLLEPERLAMLSCEAYALLATYHALCWLDEDLWMADTEAEPVLFRKWARAFRSACERHHWLPQCELADAISAAFERGALTAPTEIGWLGFDRETPATIALHDALAARGTRHRDLAWEVCATSPRLYTAPGEQDEIRACVEWVRQRWLANPQARIGILMPDLAARRAPLERELYSVLAGDRLAMTSGATSALPFEFSLGQPLAQVPLVHAALLLLRWLHEPLAQQEITWLLLSATLGAGQSGAARHAMASLDRRLRTRDLAEPHSALRTFLRVPQTGDPVVGALMRDLDAMLQEHSGAPPRASAGEWLRHISRLLRAARWGIPSDASSMLYQARESWERMLDQLATLDATQSPLRYSEFLGMLERTAQETIFAPESEDASVQVMGVYAASGLRFDAVWFLGATDSGWPATGSPHPLLPTELQRRHSMPHASAADDAALAHRIMSRIARSAERVVYSWATMSADAEQRPSPLVRHFEQEAATVAEMPEAVASLESVPDAEWQPLPPGATARGGQSALKQQAACPFQAFIAQRLQAKDLEVAAHGLSPAERGNLIHKILEGVWSVDVEGHAHLSSQEDLLQARASGRLRTMVAIHARRAMRKLDLPRVTAWQQAYLDAEEQRAADLVMEWLELEARRTPFSVLKTEMPEQLLVGDLSLKVRADRIDSVAGGSLLIDYKTGKVTTASWDTHRPAEPQLPLYATFGHVENLVGAVFGQVRPRENNFSGLVQDASANLFATPPSRKPLEPLTQEVRDQWRATLLNLAASYVRGEAQVDPRSRKDTCQYCRFEGVCRIAETSADSAEEEADDEETS